MKTVRLPIFEDGVETDDVLEVDITFFISSHRGLRYTQAEIVPKETKDAFAGQKVEGAWDLYRNEAAPIPIPEITPEQEEEVISRIIHNLPTKPFRVHREEILGEFTKPEEPIFEDFEVPFDKDEYSKPDDPPGRPYHDWRKIPGLEGYTMNPRKIIINEATDKTVGQERGAQGAKVLLSDEDGVGRRYSVDFLFAKTFPELKK